MACSPSGPPNRGECGHHPTEGPPPNRGAVGTPNGGWGHPTEGLWGPHPTEGLWGPHPREGVWGHPTEGLWGHPTEGPPPNRGAVGSPPNRGSVGSPNRGGAGSPPNRGGGDTTRRLALHRKVCVCRRKAVSSVLFMPPNKILPLNGNLPADQSETIKMKPIPTCPPGSAKAPLPCPPPLRVTDGPEAQERRVLPLCTSKGTPECASRPFRVFNRSSV